jgi:hypothetical protein
MSIATSNPTPSLSPLESFVCDYVEAIGGAWDAVEPQVYDVLLPGQPGSDDLDAAGRGMFRVAFDPEALPEHPGAQLAGFGAPLVDRWLQDAMRRGCSAELYVVGLNLAPHDLNHRVRRAITLAPGLELNIERIRPLEFLEAVFWFEATFVSDQKEQEIVPVAIDLHYLRQVRHLESLLDPARLAEKPALSLPEARRSSVAAAYRMAQERVLRTFAALANTRSRELTERTERQVARMTRYYADLRTELAEQRARSEGRAERPAKDLPRSSGAGVPPANTSTTFAGEPPAPQLSKFSNRLEALDREERLRIAELRHKGALRVHLRLLNLLLVRQPKLLLRATIARSEPAPSGSPGTPPPRHTRAPRVFSPQVSPVLLELVWDPLAESLEAAPCPGCQRPSYGFGLTRHGTAACLDCASGVAASAGKHRK